VHRNKQAFDRFLLLFERCSNIQPWFFSHLKSLDTLEVRESHTRRSLLPFLLLISKLGSISGKNPNVTRV